MLGEEGDEGEPIEEGDIPGEDAAVLSSMKSTLTPS
jgi:hypothetical protein